MISLKGKDAAHAEFLEICTDERVYLYELDAEEPLSEHFRIAVENRWPEPESRRIYVVEGVGDPERDNGFNAPETS